ncbi:protein kinase, putative [Trichomonas vaginalis G3]|uniref:Protein kinase, putative n=1 Tax=Trichomonas vaginalis (strain ATCC PRA-98 / G3) TaxID=412133 RepID=A2EAJ3_TRIV3|nr:protein kinase protein [Trichomonas vaginalis G3]EAY10304.1 protein kinase, putative [Trichomonas vaginalis G3]KAI5491021.1 protein kinase protein [Trichomonas vaginalis G3]|eukprot:XP_001322527.1 protein kinase [Trichomonas vaginalis G3]
MQSDLLCDFNDFVEQEKISVQSDGKYSHTKQVATGLDCFTKYYKQCDIITLKKLINDVQISTKMTHKVFGPIIGYAISPNNGLLVSREYPRLGTLNDAISSRDPMLEDPTNKMKIIHGIASALLYLHSNKITLTNLNSSTIWIDENCEPIIGDLSYSCIDGPDFMSNFEFDEKAFVYYSPECLANGTKKVTNKADIFAFGMVLYHLLSGEPPSQLSSREELYEERYYGGRPQFGPNFPPMFEELISMCWESEIDQRPTAQEIIDVLSSSDLILDGTNIEKYNNYIKKVAFTKEDDAFEVLNKEKADIMDLLELTKTTFSDATLEYQNHLEALQQEIEELKQGNKNVPSYENHETQIVPEKNEKEEKNPLLLPLIASSSIAALSVVALFFMKRRMK